MLRSHTCGELRLTDVNIEVTLAGWVQRVRNKGGLIWVDLRDRYGVTQLIFEEGSTDKALLEKAASLGREFVIQTKGKVIERTSKNDNKWQVNNFALGNVPEQKSINISKNYFSSSFLNQKKELVEQVPETEFISTEIVEIKTLDDIFDKIYNDDCNIFLKIDTQGFEKAVLEGAKNSLKHVKGIQLEMSLNPLYENATDFFEMYNYIKSHGFELYSLENGFHNAKTGQLNEVEGIFFREK